MMQSLLKYAFKVLIPCKSHVPGRGLRDQVITLCPLQDNKRIEGSDIGAGNLPLPTNGPEPAPKEHCKRLLGLSLRGMRLA